jgi:hypothetical protein
MDNYKYILSREWLLHSERELMEEIARNEPNTCVNRFTERLNRNRGIPVSVQTVKSELKLGGGLRNGKLEGYRIPKEKNLLKFLQKQGYHFEDVTKTVAVSAYINGYAGDLAKEKYGEVGMVSSDTARMVSFAIKKLK